MHDRCASLADLIAALDDDIPIIYSQNGSRGQDAMAALAVAKKAAAKVGVTRIASIGEIVDSKIPVFATAKPLIYDHYGYGLNSGSQGKGNTIEQAQISCLMEAVETYCMESHTTFFITSSYQSLSKNFLTANPQQFITRHKTIAPSLDEVIPWVNTYCPHLDDNIYIPAELVHCLFYHDIYNVDSVYAQSTTGVAAGLSYLEAVIHGLYEMIEKSIWGTYQTGQATCSYVFLDKEHYTNDAYYEMKEAYTFALYKIESNDFPDIPFFYCIIYHNETIYTGYGCALDLKMSLDRAISEAIQCFATIKSGTRDDIYFNHVTTDSKNMLVFKNLSPIAKNKALEKFPRSEVQKPSNILTARELFSMFPKKEFETLNEEYKMICDILNRAGHPLFFIANLTRIGIDVPVIKIISPSLINTLDVYYRENVNVDKMYRLKHRNINYDNIKA